MQETPKLQNNDAHCRGQAEAVACNDKPFRIGLALSGGGFRASIFHLGVIRRLEELGIMKYVHTISAVSGGSIIAAYYVIEMEKRLRRCRKDLAKKPDQLDKFRLEIFEEIAKCFFQALGHNLRSRAMVFSPFYHPILFIKSLWPGFSRSDIMQKEFDKWFYHGAPLDQLPAVTLPHDKACSQVEQSSLVVTGPTVVLNTTSLHTGERKGFKREPVSSLNELHHVNHNVLKLSRVVGASSAVPGLFPPTTISGDKLVDGGLSDNQGIDALVSLDRVLDHFLDSHDSGGGNQDRARDKRERKVGTSCKESSAADREDFDILLVSDASGQMEQEHRVGFWSVTVLLRAVSIFQFQLRRKILRILRWWKKSTGCRSCQQEKDADCEVRRCREFAFVHLFLNLKDRPDTPRVPSEYIPALGRIRTDLDQFSPIEREALMYHGYTLIDAQIKKYCGKLKSLIKCDKSDGFPKLEQPPLFRDCKGSDQSAKPCAGETRLRKRVKAVLEAGSSRVFLFRSWRKYPTKSWSIFGPALSVLLVGFGGYSKIFHSWMAWKSVVERRSCSWEAQVLTDVGLSALWFYVVLFLTYETLRWRIKKLDNKDYHSLTGCDPWTGCDPCDSWVRKCRR